MQNCIETLDFSSLSHEEISDLLSQHQLKLSVDEALTIQNIFLKRPPTRTECVLWSIQASEHCSYKSTRIHLSRFNTKGPHVILGAKEDAGVVSLAEDKQGRRYGVVMSHESHNHPSQIVPYEGAATGVGGNVRDVSCMGAKVIALGDSLRFGDLNQAHTHWVQQGVVSGIAGYGNPLGLPNIAGDVYYHEAYNQHCLVTVVTLGILREDQLIHSYAPAQAEDYVYILVGKPTDNSGFGGASFASANLEADAKEKNKGAVQEPDAFLQRHLLKANEALFKILQEAHWVDRVGFKDLGAGGIACASLELAEAGSYGAEIDLELVPKAMDGLLPSVVLCSETQERFMWVVPKDLVPLILTHYNETYALPEISQGACAAVIGRILPGGIYVVRYQGQELVRARVSDVTKGIVYERPFVFKDLSQSEPQYSPIKDYNAFFLKLLAHENAASRAPIYETYDKQVQGKTWIEAGWADAGVLQPFNEDPYPFEIRHIGLALSLDQNPRYNQIDAYWGAVNAVVESVRNITAVGATPIALTDCLCFGNPEIPEQMGDFVRAVQGIIDAAAVIRLKEHPEASLPVIAGNVSLYNESAKGSIPPSPMIACLGKLPDVRAALSFDLKKTDSLLFMIGARKDECGGSLFYQLLGELGSLLPKPDLSTLNKEIQAVFTAIQEGLVLAAHDISEGGTALALAEMSFKHSIGVEVTIPGALAVEKLLFGESGGFILEVAHRQQKAIQALMTLCQVPYFVIGHTSPEPFLRLNEVIDLPLSQAKEAWTKGLRERLL